MAEAGMRGKTACQGRHAAAQRLARLALQGSGFGYLLMQNGDNAKVHKVDDALRARLHKMAAAAGCFLIG